MQRTTTRRLRHVTLALLAMLLLGPPPPRASAEPILVTSTADSGQGTLRAALDAASPGDIIRFDPDVFPPASPATIRITSAPPLTLQDDNLTLDASDAGVILDGSQAPNGLNGLTIAASGCTVSGLTIQFFAGAAGNNSNGIFVSAEASGNTIGGDRSLGAGPNGHGNRLVSNRANGIEIWGSGNVVRGNFIGVDPAGAVSQGNFLSGISIRKGARDNRIGGVTAADRNVISASFNHGVYISDAGTSGNELLGNYIGTNRDGTAVIGQLYNGIAISGGASNNRVGDGTVAGRNLISGNALSGVLIEGSGTANNSVRGNYLGADRDGKTALANGIHGVEVKHDAHHNVIEGNLISGNMNHGLVLHFGAHTNAVRANTIGPDVDGRFSLGNQTSGGIDIAEGAYNNTIEHNLISGNNVDGIALFANVGQFREGRIIVPTRDNRIIANRIGVAADGAPLKNNGQGILIGSGTAGTTVQSNTIKYNSGYGVQIGPCDGNRLVDNEIVANGRRGIESACMGAPEITTALLDAPGTVSGRAPDGTRVLVYSDTGDDMELLESAPEGVPINADRTFSFTPGRRLRGPNITVRAVNDAGETSSLSEPSHLDWTILLYLNGDNNLAEDMVEVLTSLAAAGPSPGADVVALVDGAPGHGVPEETRLFDLTRGELRPISAAEAPFIAPVTPDMPSELNMGDPQILTAFYEWATTSYPSRHTLLAIVDHGGGWAPSAALVPPGTLPIYRKIRTAGGSGLSWDETGTDADYLDSTEMPGALAAISAHQPLDVLFYDVCLMGMVEVAYQARGSAAFFVSSQNIGWSPVGEEGRYVQLIQGLTAATDGRQMAARLVAAYGAGLPAAQHPYTIAAVDMAALDDLKRALDALAEELTVEIQKPGRANDLRKAYREAQKIDYDSDLLVEWDTDGFVDIRHFAERVAANFTSAAVDTATSRVITALDTAVVASDRRSEPPWTDPAQHWELANTNGLSVFLPFGEKLLYDVSEHTAGSHLPTATPAELALFDLYNADELDFVRDSQWRSLIEAYYQLFAGEIPTATTLHRALDGLQAPDITPPNTAVAVSPDAEQIVPNAEVVLRWSARDSAPDDLTGQQPEQSGVLGARLYRQQADGSWTAMPPPYEFQPGTAGEFRVTAGEVCLERYAVFATDQAGNEAEPHGGSEEVELYPLRCAALPYILRTADGSVPPPASASGGGQR